MMMPQTLIRKCKPLPQPLNAPARAVDILIDETGHIVQIDDAIPAPENSVQVDAEGWYVSPGWIDLHTHVYYGATDISVRPSAIGRSTGVSTLIDAGSAGEANFTGFRDYVIERADEAIYALLNLGSIGLVACNRVSELSGIRSVDIDRMLAVIEKNRDVIKGIKIRASHVILGDWGITPLKIAKKVSRMVRLPLMVHVGEPPPLLDEVLAELDPGDIVTHCFNGKAGGNILDDERVFSAAQEAVEKGVLFDIGHGSASFSFEVAERALQRGLAPYSISTDLHGHNIDGPVWDLATTMSKLLHLGMSLEDVVTGVTIHPAAALDLPLQREAWLSPGVLANLTLFSVEDLECTVKDSQKRKRKLTRAIQPRYSLFKGDIRATASRGLSQLASPSMRYV